MKAQTAMQAANAAEIALRILPDTDETREIRIALVKAADKSWLLYDELRYAEDEEAFNRVDSRGEE